ncbi:MAG: hypothetical protein ACRDK2_12105, partial [Solirubrobacteraceae bacterium]
LRCNRLGGTTGRMKPTHKHGTRPGPLTALGLVAVALLIAGCGGGSTSNRGVAQLHTNTASSATTGTGLASPGPSSPEAAMLAYANCMHSNGEPNYPDPKPGGGSGRVPVGGPLSSPALKAAQTKCQKLVPDGGPPAPGSTEHPSAQTVARYLKVAQCMRTHGVPDFPDPTTSIPSNPPVAGIGEISDIESVILLFPRKIDMKSPLFTRAAATCAFPLHNH